MRRGRAAGETAAVLTQALINAGAPSDRVAFAPSEIDGVRQALQWARPGDLLVLGVHANRAVVNTLVDHLSTSGWNAGDAVGVDAAVNAAVNPAVHAAVNAAATSISES